MQQTAAERFRKFLPLLRHAVTSIFYPLILNVCILLSRDRTFFQISSEVNNPRLSY